MNQLQPLSESETILIAKIQAQLNIAKDASEKALKIVKELRESLDKTEMNYAGGEIDFKKHEIETFVSNLMNPISFTIKNIYDEGGIHKNF